MILKSVRGLNVYNCLIVHDWCRDNLRNILLSVYGNKESVDEELVEVEFFSIHYIFVAMLLQYLYIYIYIC